MTPPTIVVGCDLPNPLPVNLMKRRYYGHQQKRYLGQFSNYVKNTVEDASNGGVGSMGIRDLVDVDQYCELELVPLSEGRPRQQIQRIVRGVMMVSKIDGLWLWQIVISPKSGSWEGNYPNRKGCAHHQGKAKFWVSQLTA